MVTGRDACRFGVFFGKISFSFQNGFRNPATEKSLTPAILKGGFQTKVCFMMSLLKKNKHVIRSKRYGISAMFIPILIGVSAFLLLIGPRVLDTGNIAWLESGDTAQHYLGWIFFRNTEWTFPIGLNPRFGLELGSAIVFSDSNPLLAFLFKPFSPLLPETFQYFGIWLLLCYVMQAWFAWKLTGLVSDDFLLRTLGTVFFTLSPPMIHRIDHFGHLSLTGHFLILAALYFTLSKDLQRRTWVWGILLGVAVLVHAYLFTMVSILWVCDLIGRTLKRDLPFGRASIEFAVLLLISSLVCWQAGYFSVGEGVIDGGFGFFRMNLLSPIDSSGWSFILRDFPGGRGDSEGFNYLGLGVIVLIILGLPVLLSKQTGTLRLCQRFPVLLLALLWFTLFSLSNKIGVGPYNFEYPLPAPALKIANIFRASGRMFWPVFYVLTLYVIFLIIRGYEKRTTTILLGLALVVQIVDTGESYKSIRKSLMIEQKSSWSTPLVNPFWQQAASKYAKIRFILPRNNGALFPDLAYYAATHNLSTDVIYLARVGKSALENAKSKAMESIETGKYDADTLYVLDETCFRQAALNINTEDYLVSRIDGFNVIVPGWENRTEISSIEGEALAALIPLAVPGQRLSVTDSGTGLPYLSAGWSFPEAEFTWSEGEKARIVFRFSSNPPASVLVEVIPLLSPAHTKQRVTILVNGIPATEAILTESGKNEFRIPIPENAIREGEKLIKMDFLLPDAARPKDIGINDDERRLGIGLAAFTVQ